ELKHELQPPLTPSPAAPLDLTSLIKTHPDCPLSIFGHADPVGSDDYNKTLSGRRATAIYAMLIRDASLWEHLYSSPFGDDIWGKDTLRTMLDEVSSRDGSADKGQNDQLEVDAAQPQGGGERSQAADSVAADGSKRKALFLAYMDKLCGPGLRLTKADF